MLWNTFALPRKIVAVDFKSHFGKLLYEKEKEKPSFQTFSQIERQIARGGLNDDQIAALWDGLFLDAGQIKEVLEHVSKVEWAPAWVYPMFVMAALTGARRSEMIRSRVADWDDRHNCTGHFRERKRSSETATLRMVTVVPQVAQAIDAYLKKHPGGEFLFCDEANVRLTPKSADYWFGRVLDGGKWHVLRGWHVSLLRQHLRRQGHRPADHRRHPGAPDRGHDEAVQAPVSPGAGGGVRGGVQHLTWMSPSSPTVERS